MQGVKYTQIIQSWITPSVFYFWRMGVGGGKRYGACLDEFIHTASFIFVDIATPPTSTSHFECCTSVSVLTNTHTQKRKNQWRRPMNHNGGKRRRRKKERKVIKKKEKKKRSEVIACSWGLKKKGGKKQKNYVFCSSSWRFCSCPVLLKLRLKLHSWWSLCTL